MSVEFSLTGEGADAATGGLQGMRGLDAQVYYRYVSVMQTSIAGFYIVVNVNRSTARSALDVRFWQVTCEWRWADSSQLWGCLSSADQQFSCRHGLVTLPILYNDNSVCKEDKICNALLIPQRLLPLTDASCWLKSMLAVNQHHHLHHPV
jgi:hypothetical protein